MASDIDVLLPLHDVDSRIVEIQAKAEEIKRQLASTETLEAAKEKAEHTESRYHRTNADLKDAELAQKGMIAKAEEHEKHLYSGKVVSPREVEQIEQEIKNLKSNAGSLDEKILRLLEAVPDAEEAMNKAKEEYEKLAKENDEFRSEAGVLGKQMQEEYKQLVERRKALLEGLPPVMKTRYLNIQKGTRGTAMARIEKDRQCGHCGVLVSERAYDLARHDKFVTCDQCKRMLYVQVAEVTSSE